MPINHAPLYAAVYACLRNVLPQITTRSPHARNRVFRSGNAADAGRLGADKYRTPFNSSSNDNYRWTGPRPAGIVNAKPSAGGVYTSFGMNDALLGEFAFYAFKTKSTGAIPKIQGVTLDDDVRRKLEGKPPVLTAATFTPTLATKRIFEYEFPAGLRIADLSLTGQGGRGLMRLFDGDDAVVKALKAARFANAEAAYLASDDNSLPRAMSQVVRDFLPGYTAIWVTSVRAAAALSMGDIEGDNLVFYGADGAIINDLKPKREIAFELQPDGTYKDSIGYF